MGANFFISLGFTATPPPYGASSRHLTLGPGLRARQEATSSLWDGVWSGPTTIVRKVEHMAEAQDQAPEKQVLAAWREEEARVILVGADRARGKIKAVTERSIILEDNKGRSILCPWSAIVKIQKYEPGKPYGYSR